MNISSLKSNKFVVKILIGLTSLIALLICISILLTQSDQETIWIYYTKANNAGVNEIKNVTVTKNIKEVQSFLSGLNFAKSADETLNDISNPKYKIEGEHKNSSDLDFNYYVYDKGNHYIVLDTLSAKYALVYNDDYFYLKSVLSSYF